MGLTPSVMVALFAGVLLAAAAPRVTAFLPVVSGSRTSVSRCARWRCCRARLRAATRAPPPPPPPPPPSRSRLLRPLPAPPMPPPLARAAPVPVVGRRGGVCGGPRGVASPGLAAPTTATAGDATAR